MNRCQSLTKNNKRCRAIIKDNQLFCCKNHEPINNEIISDGCCMCMEKISSSKDIIYLNCKHAFHKPCYNEWLTFSTYEGAICIICRSNKAVTIPINKKKSKNKAMYNYFNVSKILNIHKVLHNNFPINNHFDINNIYLLSKPNNLLGNPIENTDNLSIDTDEINNDIEGSNVDSSTHNNTQSNSNNNINIFINNYINNYINGNTVNYDGPNFINELNNINSIYNNILNDE